MTLAKSSILTRPRGSPGHSDSERFLFKETTFECDSHEKGEHRRNKYIALEALKGHDLKAAHAREQTAYLQE